MYITYIHISVYIERYREKRRGKERRRRDGGGRERGEEKRKRKGADVRLIVNQI